MWAYFGGKSTQAKWISLRIPYDIETYVEPFSGAFWVYFKTGFNSVMAYPDLETVVYNDWSKNNVNLFRSIKLYREFSEFIKDVKPGVNETYRAYRTFFLHSGEKTDLNSFTLLEEAHFFRALKHIYVMTHTFSGLAITSSQNCHPEAATNRFNGFRKRLTNPEFRDKIERVTAVENLDYADVIQKYDSAGAFFYVDPPYLEEATYSVDTFKGLGEHQRLADVLREIKGRFILSYYHFDELEKWFPRSEYRWETKEYLKMGGRSAEKGKAEELIIMNY